MLPSKASFTTPRNLTKVAKIGYIVEQEDERAFAMSSSASCTVRCSFGLLVIPKQSRRYALIRPRPSSQGGGTWSAPTTNDDRHCVDLGLQRAARPCLRTAACNCEMH